MAKRELKVAVVGDASQLKREVAAAEASIAGFGSNAKKFSSQFNREFLAVGAAVGIGLGFAVKSAMSFESAFAGVRKTVTGTEPELAAIRDGIVDMSNKLPASREAIAGVAAAAGQLGIKTPNILNFTRTMVDLGETTNLSSEDAANALARLANITQMPQTEFDRLGSTVVALGNNFATTESEIVTMALRLAGAGKQVGLSEDEILGFASALSSVGIEAEAGGTAFSRVMKDISLEVETGGDNLAMFAQVAGMSVEDFSTAFRTDAAGAVVSFVEGLGKVQETGGSAIQVLDAMGITEIRMSDALLRSAGAADLMRDSLDLGATAWAENNALTKEAAERYGTTESKLKIARNQITGAAMELGDQLLPALGSVAEGVGSMATGLGELPGPVRAAFLGATGLIGVGATAIGVYGTLKPKIDMVKESLSGMGGAAGFVGRNLGTIAGVATGVGVAFAGVTYLLGEAAKEQAEFDAQVQVFIDSMRAAGGVTAEFNKEIRQAFADSKVGEILADSTANLDVFTDGVRNSGTELDQLARFFQENTVMGDFDSALQATADSGNELAQELLRLRSSGEISADEMRNLVLGLDMLNDQVDTGVQKLNVENSMLSGLQESASGAAGATDDLATQTDGAADAFSDAEAEMRDAISALKDWYDQTTAQLSADIAFQASIDDITDSVKENGRSLDINTEAGRANVESFIDAKDAIIDYGVELINAGSTTTDATAATLGLVDSLANTMRQAGFTEAEVAGYLHRLGLTPDQISTQFNTPGLMAAGNSVHGYKEVIAGVPTYVNTVFAIQTGAAISELDNLINKAFSVSDALGEAAFVAAMQRPRGGAIGGPAAEGVPRWVGEYGPEVFVPGAAGKIVPTFELERMGGGGSGSTIVNNWSITQLPGESGDQLAERVYEYMRRNGQAVLSR